MNKLIFAIALAAVTAAPAVLTGATSAYAADQQATEAQMDNHTNYGEAGAPVARWGNAYNSVTAPSRSHGGNAPAAGQYDFQLDGR